MSKIDAGMSSPAVPLGPATPPELLGELAASHYVRIRERVAEHANTPATALRRLARDEQVSVRIRVARNPRTPVGAQRTLWRDGSPAVREAVRARTARTANAVSGRQEH